MTRIVFFIALMFCTLTAISQEQEKTQQVSAAQIFTIHHAKTYQAATRYNDHDVAKQALYNILVEYPQNDSILYSLSLLYFTNQQYTSAALTAQDAITINPDNLGALEIASISFANIGAIQKAIDAYESLYLKTNSIETLYQLTFLQYQSERYSESLTNTDILLDNPKTAIVMAVFNDTQGNQKEYPLNVALYNLKGLIMESKNDKVKAEEYYKKSLELAPDFMLAKDNLAKLKEK